MFGVGSQFLLNVATTDTQQVTISQYAILKLFCQALSLVKREYREAHFG